MDLNNQGNQNKNRDDSLVFEYPLQENIRSYLRLESLFQQYRRNINATNKDHHLHALKTLLEILEVLERGDIRSELIKELSRLLKHFKNLKQNPEVDSSKLKTFLSQIEQLNHWAHNYQGKFGETTRQSHFIASVKLRSNIPGGNCFFDCPELYLFLNKSIEERKQNFDFWMADIKGINTSVEVILRLIRDSASWQKNTAIAGGFILETPHQSLKLLRIKNISGTNLFPEFSCGKQRSSIHFMTLNQQSKKTPSNFLVDFELSSCQ
jgi:cell division protein ZapD